MAFYKAPWIIARRSEAGRTQTYETEQRGNSQPLTGSVWPIKNMDKKSLEFLFSSKHLSIRLVKVLTNRYMKRLQDVVKEYTCISKISPPSPPPPPPPWRLLPWTDVYNDERTTKQPTISCGTANHLCRNSVTRVLQLLFSQCTAERLL